MQSLCRANVVSVSPREAFPFTPRGSCKRGITHKVASPAAQVFVRQKCQRSEGWEGERDLVKGLRRWRLVPDMEEVKPSQLLSPESFQNDGNMHWGERSVETPEAQFCQRRDVSCLLEHLKGSGRSKSKL